MKKKTFADLFKPPTNMALQIVEEQESALSVSEIGSGSSGHSTPFGSEMGSSGTSFGSDMGSSGTSWSEGEDFMAELSRQMAEFMLIEEEEEEENHAEDSNTEVASVCEDFEVYQLKDKPRESGVGERRVKCHKRVSNTGPNYVNYRRNGQGIGGSGMTAIFLENSGSSYGSGGTGVFLPRSPNDPTPGKKRPVCPTVLIPMRVLQTLELHFSRLSDSSSLLSHGTSSPRCIGHSALEDKRNEPLLQKSDDPRFQNHQAHEEEEEEEDMRLPQEWTY